MPVHTSLEVVHTLAQGPGLGRLVQHLFQMTQVHRLGQEVTRPQLHGLNGDIY